MIPIQPFVKPANGQWEARSQEFWTNNYCGTQPPRLNRFCAASRREAGAGRQVNLLAAFRAGNVLRHDKRLREWPETSPDQIPERGTITLSC